jgi:hypothetical protein
MSVRRRTYKWQAEHLSTARRYVLDPTGSMAARSCESLAPRRVRAGACAYKVDLVLLTH